MYNIKYFKINIINLKKTKIQTFGEKQYWFGVNNNNIIIDYKILSGI